MPAVRFAALLLVLLLSGAGARDALAHGSTHRDDAPATEGDEAFEPKAAQFWSPACPDAPAHVCACGNLALCEPNPKPALIAPKVARPLFTPPATSPKPQRFAVAVPSPPLSLRAPPRAPPSFA
jgi:hypothetical protein